MDLVGGDGGFGSGEALHAVGGVEVAPRLDEAAEGDVGGEFGVFEYLFCGRTRVLLLGEDPLLDAFAVVGYPGGDCDGVFHDFE